MQRLVAAGSGRLTLPTVALEALQSFLDLPSFFPYVTESCEARVVILTIRLIIPEVGE